MDPNVFDSSLQKTSPNQDPAALRNTSRSVMHLGAQLMCLRQGGRPIEDYVMDFVELAHLTNMDEVCLMIFFRGGLHSHNPLRMQNSSRKPSPRFIGLFPIIRQVNPVMYELQFPSQYLIHPRFHFFLLKPYHSPVPPVSTEPGRTPLSSHGAGRLNSLLGEGDPEFPTSGRQTGIPGWLGRLRPQRKILDP